MLISNGILLVASALCTVLLVVSVGKKSWEELWY